MIIVSGYQGVGKSTFAKTSHAERYGEEIVSIDFESSNFDKSNPDWYKDYVAEMIKMTGVDVLFISSHLLVRETLNSLGIDFIFVIPEVAYKHAWTYMLAQRVQDTIGKPDYDKNVRALMAHILKYDDIIEELKETHKPLHPSKRPHERVELVKHPTDLKFIIYKWLDRQS